MFKALKNKVCAIGVDLGSSYLRMAQLGGTGRDMYLHAVACSQKPEDVQSGGGDWQRWAAKETKELVKKYGFKGKKVVTALPSDDVFIDQIKLPKMQEDKLGDAVFSKVKKKAALQCKRRNAEICSCRRYRFGRERYQCSCNGDRQGKS